MTYYEGFAMDVETGGCCNLNALLLHWSMHFPLGWLLLTAVHPRTKSHTVVKDFEGICRTVALETFPQL